MNVSSKLNAALKRKLAAGALVIGVAAGCGSSNSGGGSGATGGSAGAATGGGGTSQGGAAHAGAGSGGHAPGGVGGQLVASGSGGAPIPGDAGSGGKLGSEAGAGGTAGSGAGGAMNTSGAGGDDACTTPVAMPPVAGCGIYGTVALEYQVGDATSQLSFSVRLRTGLLGAVPLNQIEVHYYLSLEEDSGFQAVVDSFVLHTPDADYTATSQIGIVQLTPAQKSSSGGCQTHFIRIRNTSTAILTPASQSGDPYVEFHVKLTPNNAAPPNQTHSNDQSYQPASTTFQSNSAMGVFVCGQLVSGCTPGDSGPCG